MAPNDKATAMPTVQLPTPARFTHSGASCPLSAWRRWTAYFKRFAAAAGYGSLPAPDQVSHLLIHAGEFISDIYDSHLAATVKVDEGYLAVIGKIEAHFGAQLNASQARFEFFNERQDSRDFSKFMQEVKDKSTECKFCATCADSLVSTVFMNGVNDRKLRRHLISINNLAAPNQLLLSAIAFSSTRSIEARISERTAGASAQSSTTAIAAHQIAAKSRSTTDRGRNRDSQTTASSSRPRKAICKQGCFSHPNGRCRAPTAQCFKCKKKGHFSNVCRSVNAVEDSGSGEDRSDEETVDDIALDSLRIHELEGLERQNDSADTWWQKIQVGSPPKSVDFKLDSGAQCNVLPLKTFHKLAERPRLSTTTKRVVSYSSHRLLVRGTCLLPVQVEGRQHQIMAKFYVIDTKAPPLLGLPDCRALNLIQRVHSLSSDTKISDSSTVRTILEEFTDVFDSTTLGCLRAEQKIVIPDPPPSKKFPPRRIPMRFREKVRSKLKAMTVSGILEPTTETTRYVLPVVTVLKPDGSVRLCIDPRYINPHIERMKFPMPKAEQLFANLGDSRFFTVVDAEAAFYQLPLN